MNTPREELLAQRGRALDAENEQLRQLIYAGQHEGHMAKARYDDLRKAVPWICLVAAQLGITLGICITRLWGCP